MKASRLLLVAALLAAIPLSTHVQAAGEPSCVALARGFWVDVFQKRNADAALNYLSPNYIQHVAPPQPKIGEWVETWRGVFANPPTGAGKDFPEAQSDYVTEIVSIVGDDSFAALRAFDHGHWDGGDQKGQQFEFRYYDIFRCEDGKLAEHWYSEDPDPTAGR